MNHPLRPPGAAILDGQTAIVTGSTGAIGRAITRQLFEAGATVHMVGRTLSTLVTLAAEMGEPAERAHPCVLDLADDGALAQFCASVQQRFSRVDILVHCAGAIALDAVRDARVEDFDAQYRVNVRAPFAMTRALLPQLTDARGQIVFVNSSAGLTGRKHAAQYSATKHALRALADSVREEVNERGVRVLSVFLGRTASKMQSAVHEHEGRPYHPHLLLQPNDVSSVIMHALELPRTAEVTDISIRPMMKSS